MTPVSNSVSSVSPRAWALCGLLFLATTLNYLDRQTLSILAPAIQKEMGLDNEALGWLFSVFYYSYTLSQFSIGLALDRGNLRKAYGAAVLAWSAAAALTATARGFTGLLSFRLLLGVAESANWPAAMRIVARLLPPADRVLGNGIFTSGTSIGALIAPGLVLTLAGWLGWRSAFAAIASLGVLWFAVWVPFSRHASFADVWQPSAGHAHSGLAPYGQILRSRRFWPVFAVTVLVNPCLYFNLNWLPSYLVQARGLEPQRQIGILTLIFLGLDLGYLCCGLAVRALARRHGVERARIAVFCTATVLLGLCGLVPHLAGLEAATAVLIIENFGAGMWIAMYLTMAQEVSDAHVSTAAGLLGGSGSLAGAVAMWAVGRVTKASGSFALPMYAVTLAALAAAVAGYTVSRRRPSPPAA